MKYLKSTAKTIHEYKEYAFLSDIKLFIGNVKKAIVFPFNKEIKSIAKFEHLIDFEIAGYYDHRISTSLNKKICNIYPQINNEKCILNFEKLDWYNDFDLLICGHCDEISQIYKQDMLQNIIDKCIHYKKKLYAFDNLTKYLPNIPGKCFNQFYFPYADISTVPQNRFGKLRRFSKPSVGIYGTSSVQGKYTLQLYLREQFLKNEYKVGQISTEPSGYLFNFDYVYPTGYNSSVFINTHDTVAVLNEVLWEIERKDVDIILTGCQSGTVSYDIASLGNINFSAFDFIVSTAPDAVILCVNSFDSIDYIKRTINFIESIGSSKVISLVIFPLERSQNSFSLRGNRKLTNISELNTFKEKLKEIFNVNIFINQKEDIENIYNSIIDFF